MLYENSSETVNTLSDIYSYLYYGLGIAELGIAGAIWMFAIISAIVSFVVSCVFAIVIWIVESIPTYKLAQKVGYQYTWLAWVPFFGIFFRMYVLATMVQNKPFELFNGKIKIENRSLSFWLYVAISVFGNTIITAIVGIISVIPFIGQIIGIFTSALYLVPAVATGMMEYVFLRDVIDIFKEDKKSNRTAAIVVTVLDSLATFGFARVVYLYTLLKEKPITSKIYEI